MTNNFFKSIVRGMLRDRQSTLLNLIGLSSGLACAFLIYLWVSDERSVDKFNEKDSRLYLVLKNYPNADGSGPTWETTQGMLAQTMAANFPEVEDAVSVRTDDELGVVSYGDKNIKAKPQFADKDFFSMFSYRLLAGNKAAPLASPSGMLISDRLAKTLFNTTGNAIGKTITWDHNDEFKGLYVISGVYEAPPSNATDQFDVMFPFALYATREARDVSNWGSNGTHTYLLLKKGTDVEQFNRKIKDFTAKKIQALYHEKKIRKWEGTIFLQRYSDRYLYNHFENGRQAGGRIEYVKLFSVIALFILVIACINFMNLSTARATTRMKEVGIRKVIGASRRTLVGQYMGESVLMAFLSMAIALLLVRLLLPAFNQLTGKQAGLSFTPGFIIALTGITLVTGILAGSYPAWYLSGFKPVLVLKGKLSNMAGESWVRKGLVIFQFTISVVLIVSVLVVYKQMDFIRTRNLGYNKDNILHFASEGNLVRQLPAFLAEAKKIPGVVDASSMEGNMTGDYSQGGGLEWPGKTPDAGVGFEDLDMDYGMIQMLGLQIKEGRAFSPQFPSDSNAIIFNETAIAAMKLRNPVGQTVSAWGKKMTIVGIVKDFQFHSLYQKVTPFCFRCQPNNGRIYVKIKAGRERETMASLGSLYQQFNKGLPFEYVFLDDDYQALYASEKRVSALSRYFAGIAILISCLGLYGLAAFSAQKRRKEMGIRKVVGASTAAIALLLSKEFFGLVSLALLIGCPLAGWIMHNWLDSFAYRVTMGIAVFAVAGIAVGMVTLLTVGFQSFRSATVNPVKILKAE
jgi:ABC-type antimicrobial peptide transport system permease subunit